MPIEIPNLSSGRSNKLVACSSVTTENQAVLDLLRERTRLIAVTAKKGVKHYVLLMLGGRENKHFHMEVALDSNFSSGFLPKPNAKISEIQAVVDQFFGVSININFKCAFPLSLKQLPENGPIRLLSIDSEVAGTRVQLTKGTLAVSGSVIEEISWSLDRKKDLVVVSLESNSQGQIESDYLAKGFKLLEKYCGALVLGEMV